MWPTATLDALVRVGADGGLPGGERWGAAVIEITRIVNHRFDALAADVRAIASTRVARYEQLDR